MFKLRYWVEVAGMGKFKGPAKEANTDISKPTSSFSSRNELAVDGGAEVDVGARARSSNMDMSRSNMDISRWKGSSEETEQGSSDQEENSSLEVVSSGQ